MRSGAGTNNSAQLRMFAFFVFSIVIIAPVNQAACQSADGQEIVAPVAVPSPDDLRQIEWIGRGEVRFNSTCIACHGSKGEAGKVKSFTERSGWNSTAIYNVIKHGRIRGGNIMPPWGDSLSEEEIWYLVAYIKSLSLDFPGPLKPTP